MRRLWLLLFALLVVMFQGMAFASHPQLLLDSAELTFMRAKVAANSADWLALKSECDSLAIQAVRYPAAVGGGNSATRGYAAGSGSPYIDIGYYGDGFYTTLRPLAACYQALSPTDPTAAATYLVQIKNIVKALAQPPLTVTRASDSAVRFAHSINSSYADLKTGNAMTVYSTDMSAFTIGDTVTISGARGCTSLNGTFKISAKSGSNYSFTNTDGSAAPAINANCTLYSIDANGDSGFGTRYWVPALALGFDWTYDALSTQEKADILATMNAWMLSVQRKGYGIDASEQNYFSGYFWGLVSAYVSTDGDNPTMTTWFTNEIADRFTATNMLRDYENRWFSGGGYGEGLQAYGYGAIRAISNSALAMKMHGTDWTQAPYNFAFIDNQMQYFMGFTTPTKLALEDNEYVYAMGVTENGVTEATYIPLSHAVMLLGASRRFGSTYSNKFKSWYDTVYAAQQAAAGTSKTAQGGGLPQWSSGIYTLRPDSVDAFMYYDPAQASSDWTTNSPLYRGWGGNYAATRTDWSDTAVEVTLLGGPSVGVAGNGKTQFNSGAMTIQRANDRLVVYGLGESARSWDIISGDTHNTLHNERSTYGNKKNSIFWAGANSSETRNQGLGSRTNPPGHVMDTTTWGSSIDRALDAPKFTYLRASGLEANNTTSSIDSTYHQNAWTREVFFLRPKLVIVHDRTAVKNSADDRAMFWTFGRNVSQVGTSTAYDVSYGGVYRGRFTSLLPASPSISVVDHDNLHFLYRAEVRPSAMDHRSDNWLAVFDAATNSTLTNNATVLTSTNADVIQLDDADHSVIAFPNALVAPSGTTVQGTMPAPTLPITYTFSGTATHYIVGMAPNTAYKVVNVGSSVTIATDDGSNRVSSDVAGVLAFDATGGIAHTLSTTTGGGGSGTISGCAGTYNAGTAYSCTVTPAAGSALTGVSGCGGTLVGNNYSGTITSDCTVSAVFFVPGAHSTLLNGIKMSGVVVR